MSPHSCLPYASPPSIRRQFLLHYVCEKLNKEQAKTFEWLLHVQLFPKRQSTGHQICISLLSHPFSFPAHAAFSHFLTIIITIARKWPLSDRWTSLDQLWHQDWMWFVIWVFVSVLFVLDAFSLQRRLPQENTESFFIVDYNIRPRDKHFPKGFSLVITLFRILPH